MKKDTAEFWLYWLFFKKGVQPLIGNDIKGLLAMQKKYDDIAKHEIYGLECHLLGEPRSDFFVGTNSYTTYENIQGDTWQQCLSDYSLLLKNGTLKEGLISLEIDSSRKSESASYFLSLFDMTKQEEQIGLILKAAKEEKYLNAVQKIRATVKDYLYIKHIGFMWGRKGAPLRLVLRHPEGSSFDMRVLDALDELCGNEHFAPFREMIPYLESRLKLNYAINLDVTEDGRITHTLGLELFPVSDADEQKLVEILIEKGFSDERVKLALNCKGNVQLGEERFFNSFISHFKLVWDNGIPRPAKVYLGLIDLQKSEE